MISGTSLSAGAVWAMIESHIRVVRDRLQAAVADPKAHQVVAEDRDRPFETAGTVAVIPIVGEIFPRGNLYTYYFGGAPIDRIRAQFRKALADDTVKAIVLRIDSPGGLVDGVTEFAHEVFRARGVKAIHAMADTVMCSAAYWIGAMADDVSATPSSKVGSIGCYTEHADYSRNLDAAGITVTLVASDARKVEGNPYEPLSDDAREQLELFVNQIASTFRADVAKGRNVTVAKVKESFGEGRIFSAKDAKAAGLVDRVETFEQLVSRIGGGARRGATRAADDTPSIVADVDAPVVVADDASAPVMAATTTDEDNAALIRDQALLATVVDYMERVERMS